MSATNTIDHPVRSGPRGTAWYVLGHLTIVLADVLSIAVIAAAMLSPNDMTRVLLAAIGALLVLRFTRARVFRAAWSDVPGAFGYRSVSRGDTFERTRLTRADYSWKVVHTLVMIAGALFLAHLGQVSPDVRTAVITGVGACGLTYATVLALGGLLLADDGQPWVNQLRVSACVAFAGWVVVGSTQVPGADSRWASTAAQFGFSGAVMMLAITLVVKMMIGTVKEQEPRWAPSVQPLVDRVTARFNARFPDRPTPIREAAPVPAGWWAQWLHYLPLTLTLTVGMAAGTLLIGSGSWLGATVTVAAGLLTSLMLVPLAVRFAKGPDRD